ncbi:MAG TPA: hypothetical protein VJ123_02910 [Anaerolineales bacterium]|nr:hypothetical protein [Anaerolineales bacterium]
MPSRHAIVDWIDQCVLGDLRTVIAGIDAFHRTSATTRPLGGCNFLLAAGCCMALEYFGQVYGKGQDATSAARQYVEDFLTPVDPRYARVFGVFWSSFRNGIVHGSWPQAICVQGHGGRRIAVGASPVRGGEHFQRASDYAGPSFVISSVTFFQDIERSFDQGFRSWIMSQSDDAVLTRAAPRLLEIKLGDPSRVKEFALIMSWNSHGSGPAA